MCGRVRIGSQYISVNAPIPFAVFDAEGRIKCDSGRWSGFARQEKLDSLWLNYGHIAFVLSSKGDLPTAYYEKGVEFLIPKSHSIAVLVIDEDVPFLVGNQHLFRGDVLIVTREARTEEEKSVHHRHPLLLSSWKPRKAA